MRIIDWLIVIVGIGVLIIGSWFVINMGGNLFTWFTLEQPDHKYEIDTFMSNSEVYEFTPKSNTNMTCVMLMLDSGASVGLQCFPKVSK